MALHLYDPAKPVPAAAKGDTFKIPASISRLHGFDATRDVMRHLRLHEWQMYAKQGGAVVFSVGDRIASDMPIPSLADAKGHAHA